MQILTTQALLEKYKDYSNPADKIKRETEKQNLISLKKGLYVDDKNLEGALLAQFIYGPSYLSFEYALWYYDMIPEGIMHTFTSATFSKRKRKIYENYFGTYIYKDVPKEAFSVGVKTEKYEGTTYLIATKEKALCDKLYIMPPVRTLKDIKDMLFDNLRIDEDIVYSLNKDDLEFLSSLYHSNNVSLLSKLVSKGEESWIVSWKKWLRTMI